MENVWLLKTEYAEEIKSQMPQAVDYLSDGLDDADRQAFDERFTERLSDTLG